MPARQLSHPNRIIKQLALTGSIAVMVNEVIVDSYIAIRLRTKVCVLDLRYEKSLETDVTERVLEGLRSADVQPPAVPHRNLG